MNKNKKRGNYKIKEENLIKLKIYLTKNKIIENEKRYIFNKK